jgi:hypothetical protein
MIRGALVILALVALISTPTRNAHATVATPSLSQAYSLVAKADVDYCYWKPKKNGQWKLKCED